MQTTVIISKTSNPSTKYRDTYSGAVVISDTSARVDYEISATCEGWIRGTLRALLGSMTTANNRIQVYVVRDRDYGIELACVTGTLLDARDLAADHISDGDVDIIDSDGDFVETHLASEGTL